LPPSRPQRHKHALAALRPTNGRLFGVEFWACSAEKNDWALLETQNNGMEMNTPYGQMVWAEKYGVFVNYGMDSRTWVMRPDFSQAKWE